jgi:hypothetical protein
MRGKDCKDVEREESAGRKKQIAKLRVKTKGRCSIWRRQGRKSSRSLQRMPLSKVVPPLDSTATEENSKSFAPSARLSPPMIGGPGPAGQRSGHWRQEEKVESELPVWRYVHE